MSPRRILALFLALALPVFLPSVLHAQPYYFTITDLGTLGGSESDASAVNNLGQVVGRAMTSAGVFRAFVYANGAMTDLGTLGGDYSAASGINNLGQIVGAAALPSGSDRAFAFVNGVMIDLGTLGGDYSGAAAINDNGVVVGTAALPSGSDRAFAFFHGVMTDLGTLGGDSSRAYAIDNDNVIVGTAAHTNNPLPSDYNQNGFVFINGSMQSLSFVAATVPVAVECVSSAGIAGQYTPDPLGGFGPGGFAYLGGKLTYIGDTNNSVAVEYGINSSGAIVGSYTSLSGNSAPYASLYAGGVLYDLNTLVDLSGSDFAHLFQANAVSDTGYIVGTGTTKSGNLHAFLLTLIQAAAQ